MAYGVTKVSFNMLCQIALECNTLKLPVKIKLDHDICKYTLYIDAKD
jgi:hypothetical protein